MTVHKSKGLEFDIVLVPIPEKTCARDGGRLGLDR